MKNLRFLAALLWVLLFASYQYASAQSNTETPKKVSFSFKLSAGATTSAGVFKSDGTLVRTLWSAVKYSAGEHTGTWDGLDDLGKYAFDTSYVFKVLSNNVAYNWDGVIGNTSSSFTGSGIHHGYDLFKSMAIHGNNAYVARGYDEAQGTKNKINLLKPQEKTWILPSGQGTTQYTSHVATDGNVVYWAEFDPYNPIRYWVHGTNVGNDDHYTFTGTQDIAFSPTHSIHYKSIIDLTDAKNKEITGLAVQKKGQYLFVAHGSIDKVHVFDKKTGDLIQAVHVSNARGLSVDDNDNLWVISRENTVERYRVNANGSLSAPNLKVEGLVNALATQVSYDGSVVCVVDGGTSQQVKAFSTSTGALSWTLGQPGGYASNSVVKNDKFMFDIRTYIAFQQDGSFWLGDPGNVRNIHFDSKNNYIEDIAFIPKTYVISVDETTPTRVFAGFLEYKIDYSKTLAPANGSWMLVKNWSYNTPVNNDVNESLRFTYTLSNGKTYSTIRDGVNFIEIVELIDGGNLRRTGVTYHPEYELSPDGSLSKQWTPDYTGGYSIWVKRPLIGFDGSDNPIFGADVELERVAADPNDPAYRGQGMTYKPHEITTTGVRPNFDGTNKNVPFHLGGVKDGKYLWKTAKSTHYEYNGPFPANGDYDIGNGVNDFAGSNALALERSIFWGYHGEFWKQGQVNIWNHLYDNGLMLGQFGTSEGSYKEGYPAMAGNGFSTKLVKVGGKYYLYHNDESYHSGVHRFSISGLNTIEEHTMPVRDMAADVAPIGNTINLMAGLPYNEKLKDGTEGWSRTVKNETVNFTAKTSVKTYNRNNGDDVFMTFNEGAGNSTVSRDLGINTGVNGWKLWGDITWAGCTPNYTSGKGGVFLEVLDNAGKIIATVCYTTNYGGDATHVTGNDLSMVSGDISYIQSEVTANLRPLEIAVTNGVITFKYGEFAPVVTSALTDASAKWQNPHSLRIRFAEDRLVHYGKTFDVANMFFSKSVLRDTSLKIDHFRTISDGNWNVAKTWQSSEDGVTWNAATLVPDSSANSIQIQKDHTVTINDVVAVDQLTINDGGVLNILPTGTIIVHDGPGDDIHVSKEGAMVVKSDVTGTGTIGTSSGTIKGNVTVERYLPAKTSASYRMLAPSVNTTSSIKNNWQEGVNNLTALQNNNPQPGYGTHITGSILGINGFDATISARPSLFTFNQTSPNQAWDPINNTNVNTLNAKKGYLLITRGDRGIDINDNSAAPNNTTLRATGSVLTGTVNFAQLEGNGRNSVIANPYVSSLDWVTLFEENSSEFENYYTLWDPALGSKGGYVTVDVSGTASVRTSAATTEIQSGQAFMVKAKQGVTPGAFTIKEAHKSKQNNVSVFRTTNTPIAKLYTSLYYVDAVSNRILADGALSRFNESYEAAVDGDDAGDISNFEENISFERNNQQLSIESLPLANDNDTLFLNISNMQHQAYEWQFNASDFDPGMSTRAFLKDKYLEMEIPIDLEGPTVIGFEISADVASSDANRFCIVFEKLKALPVNILSVNGYEQNAGIKVDWKTSAEVNMDRYEVERSTNGQVFSKAATLPAKGAGTSINNYNWFDNSPANGYNYYRIRSVGKDGSSQYTIVIRVLIGKTASPIKVFPNPVKSGNVNVQMDNLKKGSYTLRMLNIAGQTMLTRKIEHSGGASTQTINADHLPAGLYQLQVLGENFVQQQQLIKL